MNITEKHESIITGKQILNREVPPGTLLKLIAKPVRSSTSLDQDLYLVVTESTKNPLCSLRYGVLWGNAIEGCKFQIVKNYELIIKN